ncbi:GNAT family N-acetyltransferase [Psychrobacillus glaciei]|uniref:GNAT family N-acetyltransferase n=1 Tax=Psychrobacillus glaciei TaxID=2283160 RepID=A0A5J6SQ91_9BACI|nr:GNAT family N-acetyltransferase [Psychrobacillus glaciei]QFF99852.1 GNAT family N-acetyltransferase [Psychrobacillus glaciei]
MITFKTMEELTFKEAHELFIRGFEGYFTPMNMSLDAFVARIGNEGLSLELSIIMFDGEIPIGFVLQGMKEVNGQKVAWNGGTGIIPEYRAKKHGTILMGKALDILKKHNVSVATLEAISINEPAIKLYEKLGYKVIDTLHFWESEGVLSFDENIAKEFMIQRIPALQAVNTDIFPNLVPWQVDPSVTPKVGGEAVIAMKNNKVLAACLVRTKQQFGFEADGVTLFQAITNSENEEGERALHAVLQDGLYFKHSLKRTTYNLVDTNYKILSFLQSQGFKNTDISQVFMVNKMNQL